MNATGPRAALFVPEESFEQLVKRQISRLEVQRELRIDLNHYIVVVELWIDSS